MMISPIIIVVIISQAPESPRIMANKGQTHKALAILARHHANGDGDDALVKWELHEIECSLEDEAQNHKSSYASHTIRATSTDLN